MGHGRASDSDDLTFVAVVQGLSGANVIKILRRDSRQSIATAMLHELMNGYSIVFSGAFLTSEATKASGQAVSRHQVGSYVDLVELQKSKRVSLSEKGVAGPGNRKIGIVC